jgi:hypothetical protein
MKIVLLISMYQHQIFVLIVIFHAMVAQDLYPKTVEVVLVDTFREDNFVLLGVSKVSI